MTEDKNKVVDDELVEHQRYFQVWLSDYQHVELQTQCAYHQIDRRTFIKLMVDKLIDDDERMLAILEEWRGQKNMARINRNIQKQIDKKHQMEEDFIISEEELNQLFDKLEELDEEQHGK